jgi:hypothetical protein
MSRVCDHCGGPLEPPASTAEKRLIETSTRVWCSPECADDDTAGEGWVRIEDLTAAQRAELRRRLGLAPGELPIKRVRGVCLARTVSELEEVEEFHRQRMLGVVLRFIAWVCRTGWWLRWMRYQDWDLVARFWPQPVFRYRRPPAPSRLFAESRPLEDFVIEKTAVPLVDWGRGRCRHVEVLPVPLYPEEECQVCSSRWFDAKYPPGRYFKEL